MLFSEQAPTVKKFFCSLCLQYVLLIIEIVSPVPAADGRGPQFLGQHLEYAIDFGALANLGGAPIEMKLRTKILKYASGLKSDFKTKSRLYTHTTRDIIIQDIHTDRLTVMHDILLADVLQTVIFPSATFRLSNCSLQLHVTVNRFARKRRTSKHGNWKTSL